MHDCSYGQDSGFPWNVSNVKDMSFMFAKARGFNQSLAMWNVKNVTNYNYIFYGVSIFGINNPFNYIHYSE